MKEKLLIVYNPFSGKGKNGKVEKLKSLISDKFMIDSFESDTVGSIFRYIIEHSKTTYDVILICGGDGTINEAIRAIVKLDYLPKIAVFPTGTMNDFATYLKMSKNPNKMEKYLINMKTKKHTVYCANDSVFVYGFAIGMLSNISYEKVHRKHIFGKLSYYFTAVREIFKTRKTQLTLHINDKQLKMDCNLLLVSSTNRIAGYRVKETNGLRVVIFKGVKLFFPFKLLFYFLFGIAKYKFEASEFSINSNNTEFNTDGECNYAYNSVIVKKLNEYEFIQK